MGCPLSDKVVGLLGCGGGRIPRAPNSCKERGCRSRVHTCSLAGRVTSKAVCHTQPGLQPRPWVRGHAPGTKSPPPHPIPLTSPGNGSGLQSPLHVGQDLLILLASCLGGHEHLGETSSSWTAPLSPLTWCGSTHHFCVRTLGQQATELDQVQV